MSQSSLLSAASTAPSTEKTWARFWLADINKFVSNPPCQLYCGHQMWHLSSVYTVRANRSWKWGLLSISFLMLRLRFMQKDQCIAHYKKACKYNYVRRKYRFLLSFCKENRMGTQWIATPGHMYVREIGFKAYLCCLSIANTKYISRDASSPPRNALAWSWQAI